MEIDHMFERWHPRVLSFLLIWFDLLCLRYYIFFVFLYPDKI